ncbi:MAG: 16S rRNA (cytosine(1402)-N(4))-methyltransferase RsmH [Bacilli bacterium]
MGLHKSVLLDETIKYLNIQEDGIYVDATIGYGGHSTEILKRIKKGFLFAFDQDVEAISYSNKRLGKIGANFEVIKANFRYLKEELKKRKIDKINGILFDLGVSSPQLDNDIRGFSYHKEAKLDMRMDKDQKFSAYELVNEYSYEDLMRIFFEYGEEKYSKSIAKNIIKYRENKRIETTLELVDIIKKSMPYKATKEKHPARKVFQAIRIEVNNEMKVLEEGLRQAIELLDDNGRLCIITFHSLEDRICKNILKEYSDVNRELKGLPSIPKHLQPKLKLLGKIKPSKKEVEENSRARSAVLRIVEKIEKE